MARKKRNITGLRGQPELTQIKFPCSKLWSARLATSVYSCLNFTVNSILSRWWVPSHCVFAMTFLDLFNFYQLQYWGWAKYRYRQVNKNMFKEAKDTAEDALNTCPIKVIRCFINRSLRWMSAYCMGLTGKAAQWAVCKQKNHCSASTTAMMHLDAVLNSS